MRALATSTVIRGDWANATAALSMMPSAAAKQDLTRSAGLGRGDTHGNYRAFGAEVIQPGLGDRVGDPVLTLRVAHDVRVFVAATGERHVHRPDTRAAARSERGDALLPLIELAHEGHAARAGVDEHEPHHVHGVAHGVMDRLAPHGDVLRPTSRRQRVAAEHE